MLIQRPTVHFYAAYLCRGRIFAGKAIFGYLIQLPGTPVEGALQVDL